MIPPALNKTVIPPGRLHHTREHLRPDEIQRLLEAAPDPSLSRHPPMLHHACGYDPANGGADTRLIQGYLGHRNIQHTKLAPNRFKNLF